MNEWAQIDLPWFEVEGFLDIVLDKAHILDICDKCGLEYSPSATGDFTHRMKCPLPIHDEGGERTASFFMSEDKNNFYCFGCNSGGDVINLVTLYTGKPHHEVLRWIAALYGITGEDIAEGAGNYAKKPKRPIEETLNYHVFNTGILIREFVRKGKDKQDHEQLCRWADTRFKTLDKFLDTLGNDDWEVAKKYHDRIEEFIHKRSKHEL